jgi:hypothetical protein
MEGENSMNFLRNMEFKGNIRVGIPHRKMELLNGITCTLQK